MRSASKRMATGKTVCALFLCVATSGAVGAPQSGGTTAGSQEKDDIRGLQCGFDATVFALEYFGIEYQAANVASGLPVSEGGTSLADVQLMAASFGLKATAREGVTSRQLAEALRRDRVAIVPLPVSGRLNHYFVAALDNNGDAVLANVPYCISALEDEVVDRQLQKTGGVVLFLERARERSDPMSDHIRVSPSRLELGEFMVTGPTAAADLDAGLELCNTSEFPIMVSRIQTSCGCTKADWPCGILRPGERRAVHFKVFPGAWGEGEKERQVLLTFGDGSTLAFVVHGVGETPKNQQRRLEVSQDSVSMDLTGKGSGKATEMYIGRVSGKGLPLGEVAVATDSPWLAAKLVQTGATAGEVWATINTGLVVPELDKSSNTATATISLSRKTDVAPASIHLTVFRREFFRVSHDFLRMRRGDAAKVLVRPIAGSDRLKVVDVRSESDAIRVAATEEEGAVIVTIDIERKIIPPRYSLVRCEIESSLGRHGGATVVIEGLDER